MIAADAAFDLVVNSFALHHWPDPHAGPAEVMRVLRPGGKAIIKGIASPIAMVEAHAGAADASDAPSGRHQPSGPGWLVALRMLLKFRRLTPQRFEFAKP